MGGELLALLGSGLLGRLDCRLLRGLGGLLLCWQGLLHRIWHLLLCGLVGLLLLL
jgi:hypothetical protein